MASGFTESPVLIEASGVSLNFASRTILSDVGVTVRAGEIVTLIGPNGAGKSTLVRVILGLMPPSSGKVERRGGLVIGYMPQNLTIDPIQPLTIARFLTLGARRKEDASNDRLESLMTEVGAGPALDSPVQAMSSGEMRRVMLARALLRNPDLLVLDEPGQGVDINGQAELYRLIGRIRDERGCGVLMVSHDLHLVMAETDHVICLNRHVCCQGHPEAVTRDPVYADLFGEQAARGFAFYHHNHDHRHGSDGRVVPLEGQETGGTGDHG